MSYPHLENASILIVEDEPLIVMDISLAFEKTGAHLTTTSTIQHAKLLVEHDGLTAAILDHALPDGDCNSLCERLIQRRLPFLIYTGYGTLEGQCADAPRLKKPATGGQLLDAMEALIRNHKSQTDTSTLSG